MNKLVPIALILALVLLSVALIAQPFANATAPPTIQNPTSFTEDTIQGGNPQTVDYSWAYDTASGQIVQNTMDTLIVFNGEHTDQYLPSIATQWNLTAGTWTSTNSIAGLWFENNIPGTNSTPNADGMYAGLPGATATYDYRYYFEIRPNVMFQEPYNYSLTAQDVVYSFQRTLVQDRVAGPQWMLYEPLMDQAATADQLLGGLADLTNPTQVAEVGALIENSIVAFQDAQGNWWVYFNLMYPGPYNGFYQIMCQTWSSIESQQWIDNQVIGYYGRLDWPGFTNNNAWTNFTSWNTYTEPTISPLDSNSALVNPTAPGATYASWLEYGSGPFVLSEYVTGLSGFFYLTMNPQYFGGWPASYPSLGSPPVAPAGYIQSVTVTWANPWATAYGLFESGAIDFVALPADSYIPSMYSPSAVPPYTAPTNYPLGNVRCIAGLPELEVDAEYFTFDISPGVQPVLNAPGVFGSGGIPSDFFGNPTWGLYIRQAFAEIFNYSAYIASDFLGEGISPETAIIPGLNFYNSSIIGYSDMYPSGSLAAADASLTAAVAHGAWGGSMANLEAQGFDVYDGWNSGNTARYDAVEYLVTGFQELYTYMFPTGPGNTFIITPYVEQWGAYLTSCAAHQLPAFFVGWLADFPDANDFAFPFYDSAGAYGEWQLYSDPAMNAAVVAGALGTTNAARQAAYNTVQELAIADCPSFPTVQPTGRHFEQDWVVGWYYNPIYPGIYFYNLWKYWYLPESLNPSTVAGFNEPADVTYQGKVDIKSVHAVAAAYGAYYGPPETANWIFRADVNLDRKIDIKDVHYVAALYGEISPTGVYGTAILTSKINGVGVTAVAASATEPEYTVGTPLTFAFTTTNSTAVNWEIFYLVSGAYIQQASGTGNTFVYTPTNAGNYAVLVFMPPTGMWEFYSFSAQ